MMSDFKRPEIISYQGDEYYKAVDLKTYDSCYFYGTSTGIRRIIQKKNIDKSAYHYATFAKRKGWSSDDQEKPCKKAILLLRRNWVEKNIPRMMTGEDGGGEHQNGYEYPEAPDLLILEDEEKFRDHKGVTVDIETRGERTPKGIYFLAKDVSEAFGMNTLLNTIVSKGSYVKGTHYDTFVRVSLDNYIQKKQLFITYEGMLKLLFSSRGNTTMSFNVDIFINWVQYVSGTDVLRYKLNIQNPITMYNSLGYVYIIKSDNINMLKIGFWKSSLSSLKSRYITYYGKNLTLLYAKTNNAPLFESAIHSRFKKYNISNELFIKDKIDEYITYIDENSEDGIHEYTNNDGTTEESDMNCLYRSLPENIEQPYTHPKNEHTIILRLEAENSVLRLEAENSVLRLEAENQKLRLEAENQKLRLEAENQKLRLEAENQKLRLEAENQKHK